MPRVTRSATKSNQSSPIPKTKSTTKPAGSRKCSGVALDRRRAVHLKCEHRRRKEIQDAIDLLNAELPPTVKERSKISIVEDSVNYIQELILTLDKLLNTHQVLVNQVNAK